MSCECPPPIISNKLNAFNRIIKPHYAHPIADERVLATGRVVQNYLDLNDLLPPQHGRECSTTT